MAAVSTIIAGVGLAVSVAGTAASFVSQQKQAKAQKKANQERQRQQEVQNLRSRRAAVREAQIKRAAVLNFAAAGDFEGSSPVSQASGSISSQLGTNIGFSESISASNRNISTFNQQASDAGFSANLFGSIGGLGLSAASNSKSIANTFNSVFDFN